MVRKSNAHTDLVNVCVQYLQLSRIPAWVNNTGAVKLGECEKPRFVRFGIVGASDIVGCLPPTGRFLGVECKTGTGKPTPVQESFLQMINDAGGLGIVVYELDDLQAALDERKD